MNGLMKFGVALELLKQGSRIRRMAWNKDTYVYLVVGSFNHERGYNEAGGNKLRPALLSVFGISPELFSDKSVSKTVLPYIVAEGEFVRVPGFSLLTEDILANDWVEYI